MVNSQFFFIFMLQQVERFRPLVEHCRAECCSAVLSVGTALAAAVAPRYPGLCSTVAAVVEEVVSDAAELLLPELDGVFEKERNPFTENQVYHTLTALTYTISYTYSYYRCMLSDAMQLCVCIALCSRLCTAVH
jgi:hypothetical protein